MHLIQNMEGVVLVIIEDNPLNPMNYPEQTGKDAGVCSMTGIRNIQANGLCNLDVNWREPEDKKYFKEKTEAEDKLREGYYEILKVVQALKLRLINLKH